ncbi:MlaD family protein [Flavobacterium tegetincola]|uniref:MlaD family protein n=1 Tax=Flavobacterium tegetincola TaxID=150172 RepID=UPI000414CACF|nr:MlaD family protein [Flavobacterium tegetincola]
MEFKNYKIKLGMFVTAGIILFFLAIFVIGKQKNLFDPVFTVKANFENVSGLQVGNAVRFSGINVGTVDQILIVNDSTVQVTMLVKKDVQKFIKDDSEAGIGSEGIIGDKLIVLSRGGSSTKVIKEGQVIASNEPIETDAIIESLQMTADNAAIATEEIAEIMVKINDGKGSLGKLINDDSMAESLDATMTNLKTSTKKLDENMEAAKSNFLLRGYFKKKERAKERQKKAAEKEARKNKK